MRSFFLFGIGGLIARNAIFSDMDFFTETFTDQNPSFVFPNMNILLSVAFQLVLINGAIKITYKNQLMFCFAVSFISLVSLPLVAKLIEGQAGFYISCSFILLQGLANAVGLNGLYGIVSYLPLQCIIAMSTGHGFAGILMNIVRYITLLGFFSRELTEEEFKSNKFHESLIYFSFSALVCLFCILSVFYLYKNKYFRGKLLNSCEFLGDRTNMNINSDLYDDSELNTTIDTEKIRLKEKEIEEKDESVFPYLWDLSILIFINYVITFSVFPGAALVNELFGMSSGYNVNTLITIFNVFDSIGRYIPNYIKVSKNQLTTLVFLRLIFLFSYPILINIEKDTETGNFFGIILLLQLALLAISNGFITTVTIFFAPKEVPKKLTGKSGSCISFFLVCGISFGTLFAFLITRTILI